MSTTYPVGDPWPYGRPYPYVYPQPVPQVVYPTLTEADIRRIVREVMDEIVDDLRKLAES